MINFYRKEIPVEPQLTKAGLIERCEFSPLRIKVAGITIPLFITPFVFNLYYHLRGRSEVKYND